MPKDTRSKTNLPGDIREYLFENSGTVMPDPTPPPATVDDDIKTIITLMTKTLAAVTEGRTTHGPKLEECPQKRSTSSLDAWIQEVLLWDESNTGNDAGLNAKKYLKFLDSVHKSEGCEDLKNLVQVEFVENETFDKKGVSVIKDIVKKIKEKLGQSDLEKCSEAWLQFINIKQEQTETATSFVTRFEKAETQLKNVNIIIPNKALAIHLINRSGMEEQSKENVITKTKLDDESEIYPSMKKSIREMKGKLTKNEGEGAAGHKTMYGRLDERHSDAKGDSESKSARERPWRRDQGEDRSRKDRSNSKYRPKRNSSKYRNRSREYSRRDNRYQGSGNDGAYYSREYQDSRRRSGSYRRDDSNKRSGSYRQERDSYRGREKDSSRNRNFSRTRRSQSKHRGISSKRSSSDEVKIVHYSKYGKGDPTNNSEVISDTLINCEASEKELVEIVYNEGNSDIDPYKMVVDSGCPKTVTGRPWIDAFIESKGDISVKLEKEKEHFRFGPSQVYTSNENYKIEVHIGKLKEFIKVSVVDADIPLLLGLDYQVKWGMVIDIGEGKIHIRKSNETFKIRPGSSHWTLPTQSNNLHKQAKNLVFNVNLLAMDEKQLRKHVKKVHKNLSHKTEEQLVKLFQMAGKDTAKVKSTIKHVVDTCNICRRYKKTPPRPKVAMPEALTINEVVSLDLKERRDKKKQILYMCDEFSGYMVAEVINNKLPETVIKAFDKRWVREGPGVPDRGIFADNGGEFKNPEMKEMAAKYGLSLKLTAAHSPWSNGKNERNHYTCDIIVDKLMEEDHKLSLEEAVSHAVNSKNMQITRKGFSPRQLMFGKQGVVPGITDGNPASMEPVTESDSFRRAFVNRQRAEELYRKVDANERIQKALAQNTQGYVDHKYFEGDDVLFKEDGKSRWSGPGKVTGMEGNKVRIIQSGYDRTVPTCRVIPYKNDKYMEDEEVAENSEENLNTEVETNDAEPPIPNEILEQEETENREARPKMHSNISYKVIGDKDWRKGKVCKVGKKNGNQKFRCWIKSKNGTENFDFVQDISDWKYCQVEFDDASKTYDDSCGVATEILHTGVWYLQNQNYLVDEDKFGLDNLTYVLNILKKYHDDPEVIESKAKELEKWEMYKAFKEVDLTNQHVLGSRWVVVEKPDGRVKSRFVVKGNEERGDPRSDSPTVSKDSFKMFLAICANEGFRLKSFDVTTAFLQGKPLQRDIFIKPPLEKARPGKTWKLLKACYGLYDASRKWYIAVRETLLEMKMKSVSGDDAFFYILMDGKLAGLCIIHVDDFLMGGNDHFYNLIEEKLAKRFTFGKIETENFKFTGLSIQQTSSGIFVDQNEYIQSIKPIKVDKLVDKNTKLSKELFAQYRGLTGQLNWAAENTRPDIAFDTRELATKNKEATYEDIYIGNKVLKKAQLEKDVTLKYPKLGKCDTLKVIAYTDSSYRNAENKEKSVGGRFIGLVNEKGACAPLLWKSKTIQQVCKSVKTAETRSLERGMEDGIYLARIIKEIYSGVVSMAQLPVVVNIDSKTLLDSLNSSKQIDEKTVRHLIAWIKQQKDEEKTIQSINWVKSAEQIADVFTKKNAKTDDILNVVTQGNLMTH